MGRENVSVICPGCAFPVVIAIVFLLNDAFIKSLNQCAQGSRFIESMAFTVSCRNCEKHFKTGYSTKKHHEKSHPELQFDGGLFKNCQGHPLVDQPIPKQLEGEELESYKTWLAILAEQMSGSLNPNAKGKTLKDHGIQDQFRHEWHRSKARKVIFITHSGIPTEYRATFADTYISVVDGLAR